MGADRPFDSVPEEAVGSAADAEGKARKFEKLFVAAWTSSLDCACEGTGVPETAAAAAGVEEETAGEAAAEGERVDGL